MVKRIRIYVLQLTCDRCGWAWQIPEGKQLPRVCYRCKSSQWDKPRRTKKEAMK